MFEHEKLIVDKLQVDPNLILKRKIRGLPGFTFIELIKALINSSSVEKAASLLGYSTPPVKVAIKNHLIPLFKDRSKEFGAGKGRPPLWRYTLLETIGYRYCNQCHSIFPIEDFTKHYSGSKSGLDSICYRCKSFNAKIYKTSLDNRIPKWVYIPDIEEIYNKCPKGYHVDHIIPLHGEYVSGLHVPQNLQYLTAKQNISKGNRYIIN